VANPVPVIALTLGDPDGIGPEIVSKSLAATSSRCARVVIGTADYYPDISLPHLSQIEEVEAGGVYFYDIPLSDINTDPSFEYVRMAVEWAVQKKVAAIVTAPISKEKWLRAGLPFKGHTEFLAEAAGVKDHCMFFWSDDLKVALFTVHIPLKEIFRFIRQEKLVRFIRFVEKSLTRLFSRRFTMIVAGVNPHAGENGFLGTEELDEIAPAVAVLKKEMQIEGPYPPDVVFIKARGIPDSVVISLYHDQGLIPFKLLNINSGVNMTLGLPYIRTSPDHGTAYDIAGKGIANPASMISALCLADQLVK